MVRQSVLATLALSALALPVHAQDAYVVGITGGMTGSSASTYAPTVEAARLYIDRVNAAGGVNGKQIKLVIQDDSAEPSKAAANAKKLLTQDNAILLVSASVSSTYAPIVNEAKRANIPILFGGGVCPKEASPPADPNQFCSTSFASTIDSRAAMSFINEVGTKPVKIGFAAMAIPISRSEIEFAEQQAKELNMTNVGKEIIPPATADYTPYANKIKDAEPAWVFSWAPWVTQIRSFEALRRLGWQGSFITWAHIEAENELVRVKDDKFYVFGGNALFSDNLPVQREIIDAARKANVQYPVNQLAEGWVTGMVIEAVLKAAGWPADAAKVRSAMETVKVDTKGLRGGPIEWTKENHLRTRQYYRVYRWDSAKSSIVQAKDWMSFDVK
jgi:branched-chain amino acid transport system substrate-binding protein